MSKEVELDPQVSPGEIMSKEVELDPQVSPGEIMSKEVELGLKVGLLLLQLFLNSNATDIVFGTLLRTAVETATRWYTSCYAMARGHCLNILVTAVHGPLGLRCARSSRLSFWFG